MTSLLRVLILVILVPAHALAGEFHVEALRTAVVREQPSTASNAIARMERGDVAVCITKDDRALIEANFYRVRLRDGRLGWVSRYRVRLKEGVPPSYLSPAKATPEDTHRAYHLSVGKPLGYVEFVNEGYIVGYDPRLKIPAWVQYRITAGDIEHPVGRSDAFAVDVRLPLPSRALLSDYAEAGSWDLWNELGLQPPRTVRPAYARGHMAPSRDLSRTVEIERSSNLLSNIAPQVHHGYNSGVWSTLEGRVRRWAELRGDLTVVMGPVFLPSTRQLTPLVEEADRVQRAEGEGVFVLAQPPTERQVIYNVVGDGSVAVPTAFFKVIVDHSDREIPDVLAFLIPHYRHTGRRLDEFLVSVREIEELTGLDLLSDLDREVQDEIESRRATQVWPLN